MIIILISCGFPNKNSQQIETYNSCTKDTTLSNETFIKYHYKLEDSICLVSLSIKGTGKNNIDSFYFDKNDCRMIPKLIHHNDSSLFLLSGSGFTFRKLHFFYLKEKQILNTQLPFDNLESDLNYSYYPYIIDEKLYVLKIDSLQKVKEYDTKILIQPNLIRQIIVENNEITVIQNNNKVISATVK